MKYGSQPWNPQNNSSNINEEGPPFIFITVLFNVIDSSAYNIYFSPNIVQVKENEMGDACVTTTDKRNACSVLVGTWSERQFGRPLV